MGSCTRGGVPGPDPAGAGRCGGGSEGGGSVQPAPTPTPDKPPSTQAPAKKSGVASVVFWGLVAVAGWEGWKHRKAIKRAVT